LVRVGDEIQDEEEVETVTVGQKVEERHYM